MRTQREHLSQVLHSYQGKLAEVLGYFTELDGSRDLIARLKRENEVLKARALDLRDADAAAAMAAETALEARLMDDSALPLEDLVRFLRDRLRLKAKAIAAVKAQTAAADSEVAALNLKLAAAASQSGQVGGAGVSDSQAVAKAKQMLAAFYVHAANEKEIDERQLEDIEREVFRLHRECAEAETRVYERRAALLRVKDDLDEAHAGRQRQLLRYREEVVRALEAHEALIADLSAKTTAFSSHCAAVQRMVSSCAELDRHFGAELKCPNCYRSLTDPHLLWPCGHMLCYACVSKGHEILDPHKQLRRLVCLECRNAVQAAQAAIHDDLAVREGDPEDPELLLLAQSAAAAPELQPASSGGAARAGSREGEAGALAGNTDEHKDPARTAAAAAAKAALRELTSYQNPYVKPQPFFNKHHFGGLGTASRDGERVPCRWDLVRHCLLTTVYCLSPPPPPLSSSRAASGSFAHGAALLARGARHRPLRALLRGRGAQARAAGRRRLPHARAAAAAPLRPGPRRQGQRLPAARPQARAGQRGCCCRGRRRRGAVGWRFGLGCGRQRCRRRRERGQHSRRRRDGGWRKRRRHGGCGRRHRDYC